MAILVFVLVSANVAIAGPELAPLNPDEASAWTRVHASDPDFPFAVQELKSALTSKFRVAKNKFAKQPENPGAQSEMGNAFHGLGHVAEIENDFVLAAEYHRESVKYYRMSGGVLAAGSWDDGVNHALEHVFMDLYDQGRWLEAQDRVKEARDSFRSAWKFALSEELGEQYDVGRDPRFIARMRDLRSRSDFGLITQSMGDRFRNAVSRLLGRATKPVEVTCESMFVAAVASGVAR